MTDRKKIAAEIRSLLKRIAAVEAKRRLEKSPSANEALRLRHDVGRLAEEYADLVPHGTVWRLADDVGPKIKYGSGVYDRLRRFHRTVLEHPKILDQWVEEGITWSEAIRRMRDIPVPRRKRLRFDDFPGVEL